MLLDEAYVDEESCESQHEEKKMSEDDNISLADDDFEETALAEKEWAEREAETKVENKEARQGRVRSGYTKLFKLIIPSLTPNKLCHIFLHTSR